MLSIFSDLRGPLTLRPQMTFLFRSIASLFLSLILFPFSLLSQETELYEGDYTLKGGVPGKAFFNYFEEDGDSVKHGEFRFQTSNREEANGGRYHGIRLTGEYRKGIMDGAWDYVNQQLLTQGKGRITGREIVFPSKGEEANVSGSFEDGKADGEWSAYRYRVADSELTDTLFFATNKYEEGEVSGPFEAGSEEVSASGDMNDDGFLNGEWRIEHFHEEVIEIRDYEEGVLREHYMLWDEDTLDLKVPGRENEGDGRDTVPMNSEYLQSLFFSTSINSGKEDNKAEWVEKTNSFLERSLFAFFSFEGQRIWDLLHGNEGVPAPKVKARVFPYSEEEEKELARFDSLLERNGELFREHYKNPQVDLGKHSYEEVSFYYEVMKHYHEGNSALKKVHDMLADTAFLYIDRNAVRQELIPELDYPDSLAFMFEGEKERRSFDFPKGIDEEVDELGAVLDHLGAIQEDMERIGAELDRILEKYKKQDLLAEKEGELVRRRDSLRSLFEGRNGQDSLNVYHEKVASSVLGFYERRFEAYAELGLEKKIDDVDELIACYGEGLMLFHRLKELPSEVERIDELYTESNWHPIHFTNMDERIKKPLYEAFDEELLPFLIEDLRSSLECGQIEGKAKNFRILFRRMTDLREQKTKVLEKKVGKAEGADEVLSMLDLNLNID